MSDLTGGNGTGAGATGSTPDTADLRALVREVLRETLPSAVTAMAPVAAAPEPAEPRPQVREVAVTSDAELDALVRAVAHECADPAQRARLAEGSVQYRLAGASPDAVEAAQAAQAVEPVDAAEQVPDLRVERGAVTERHVRQAERAGARVVAARGVVVTPLARDRARSAGVDITKEQ
jgi:hypothetical protein